MSSEIALRSAATRLARRIFLAPALGWGTAERIGAGVVIMVALAVGAAAWERGSASAIAAFDVAVVVAIVLGGELAGRPKLGRIVGLLVATAIIAWTLGAVSMG